MNDRPAVDWKSIVFFVVLAVALSTAWAVVAVSRGFTGNPQNAGIAASFSQVGVLIAAGVTIALFSRASFRRIGWRLGPGSIYVKILVCLFLLLALLTATFIALGFSRWTGGTDLSPMQIAISVPIVLVFTSVFSFCEEIGWRGFLLPKLLPLGVRLALLASGGIWFLFEAPLVYLGLVDAQMAAVNVPVTLVCHVLQTVATAVIFGYLRLRYNSVFVPSFAHGAMNALAGVSTMLVVESNPIWGDLAGPIATALVVCVAIWFWLRAERELTGRLSVLD